MLRAKIAQQKYELKILQSQINPHFLYNSLSLINGKAIMAGQQDISQMARLLSTFYRTMLKQGSSITTVDRTGKYKGLYFYPADDAFRFL